MLGASLFQRRGRRRRAAAAPERKRLWPERGPPEPTSPRNPSQPPAAGEPSSSVVPYRNPLAAGRGSGRGSSIISNSNVAQGTSPDPSSSLYSPNTSSGGTAGISRTGLRESEGVPGGSASRGGAWSSPLQPHTWPARPSALQGSASGGGGGNGSGGGSTAAVGGSGASGMYSYCHIPCFKPAHHS